MESIKVASLTHFKPKVALIYSQEKHPKSGTPSVIVILKSLQENFSIDDPEILEGVLDSIINLGEEFNLSSLAYSFEKCRPPFSDLISDRASEQYMSVMREHYAPPELKSLLQGPDKEFLLTILSLARNKSASDLIRWVDYIQSIALSASDKANFVKLIFYLFGLPSLSLKTLSPHLNRIIGCKKKILLMLALLYLQT